MYNELLKQEFVSQFSDNPSKQKSCIWLFNAVEKFENVWNADICTKDGDDLQRVVDYLLGIRTSAKAQRYNLLKEYFAWCVEKGVPGAKNAIKDINTSGTTKMRSRTVSSPVHLQMYLDGVFQEESKLTRDNLLRAYCWLAYIGLSEDDIITLRSDEVDLDKLVVTHGGKHYKIYAEAIPSLRNCKEMSFFYYRHPNYDKAVPRNRAQSDLLLRGTSPTVSAHAFRNDLSSASKRQAAKNESARKTEEEQLYAKSESLRLSYYRIWISGLFYRAFLLEAAGVAPDFSEAASNYLEERHHEFSGRTYTRNRLYSKARSDYLIDYKIWKKTFYQ